MTGYFLFGGFRNLFGIILLSALVWWGMPVTPALLLVVCIGLVLYTIQVRLFVGKIHLLTTASVFVLVFFANRFLLWLIFERLGAPIYVAQIISVLVLTSGSYLFLKIWRRLSYHNSMSCETAEGQPPSRRTLRRLWQRGAGQFPHDP